MRLTTQGIVLRETNYKEADKILTVLTRDLGKRTVKARGCRRKNSPLAAAAQLLAWSDMTLFEYRDRLTLNEAEPLECFWGVRGGVEELALGSYFAESMEAVTGEGESEPALLSLILNSLYAMDRLKKPLPLVKGAYELKLMALAGDEPLLECCAVCGAPEPEEPRFNRYDGLLRCAKCAQGAGDALALSGPILAAMRHVVYGDPKRLFSFRLEPGEWRQFARVCEGFLTTQLDRGFRTLDFYHSLVPAP